MVNLQVQQAIPPLPLQLLQPSTSQPQQQQQQQQEQQQPQQQHTGYNCSLNAGASASAPISLDVGGHKFRTTLQTLLAVPGSLLWKLLHGHGPPGVMQRLPSGELFIDRNGAVFHYVLEYLRACANQEGQFEMPTDAK